MALRVNGETTPYPICLRRRYTLLAMLVVIALTRGLAQSPTGAGTPQSPSASPQAITTTRLSPAEISQLQAKAGAGDAEAQLALAQAYEDGNGLAQSDEKAVNWYRKAEEQGSADAQNSLGVMYRLGRGAERNKEEAVKWYQRAAHKKNAKAMFNLATAYYNGDGVPIDDVYAYAWFLLAQEGGSKSGDEAVRRMEAELRPYQITDALTKIGEMYEKGEELSRDDAEAAKWYRKAADQGSMEAAMRVASRLILGQGVTQNYAEARRLCEEAAKRKFSPGAFCLGLLYQGGLGVAKDPAEAAKCGYRT